MERLIGSMVETIKTYPFSIGAYMLLSLLPMIMISIGCINIKLNPAPNGYGDHRGDGLMFGFLLVFLLVIIFIMIMIANIIHQKNKAFYAKFIAFTITIYAIWYGTLMVLA